MSETKIYVIGVPGGRGRRLVRGTTAGKSRGMEVVRGMAGLTGCQRGPKSWKVNTRGQIDNQLSANIVVLGSMSF